MNLVLFDRDELDQPLPRSERRAVHIVEVLRRSVGDSFDAGVIDGPRGKATLTRIGTDSLDFSFAPNESEAPIADAITLIIGLPRPQTARDILRDATSLGVAALHFVVTDKGERNYAQSTLWTRGEWRRHLILGAEQACMTRLPLVVTGQRLGPTLAQLEPSAARVALDNYESPAALGSLPLRRESNCVLAIGSERGWSAAERDVLRQHAFALAHLGPRVLRTETAVVASLAIVRAKIGLM